MLGSYKLYLVNCSCISQVVVSILVSRVIFNKLQLLCYLAY